MSNNNHVGPKIISRDKRIICTCKCLSGGCHACLSYILFLKHFLSYTCENKTSHVAEIRRLAHMCPASGHPASGHPASGMELRQLTRWQCVYSATCIHSPKFSHFHIHIIYMSCTYHISSMHKNPRKVMCLSE